MPSAEKRECGEELLGRERVVAVVGEEAPEEEPDQADRRGGERRPRDLAPAARDAERGENEQQEEEGERAGREGERGEQGEGDEPSAGECNERDQREREPETVGEGRREHRRRRDDREAAGCPDGRFAPGLTGDEREGGSRRGRAENGEELDPDERGERVVEEAVADERVAARIPVVRPQGEPVADEDVELEDVRGQVRPGRADPHEQCGQGAREGGVHHRLRRSQARVGHRHAARPLRSRAAATSVRDPSPTCRVHT